MLTVIAASSLERCPSSCLPKDLFLCHLCALKKWSYWNLNCIFSFSFETWRGCNHHTSISREHARAQRLQFHCKCFLQLILCCESHSGSSFLWKHPKAVVNRKKNSGCLSPYTMLGHSLWLSGGSEHLWIGLAPALVFLGICVGSDDGNAAPGLGVGDTCCHTVIMYEGKMWRKWKPG